MSELLNLSTVVDRATINITSKKHPTGKQYELRNLADVGPYEYALFLHHSREVDELKKLKKLTPAQERSVKKLLDAIVSLVVFGLEPAVLKALTEQQKETIVVSWTALVSSQGAAEGNGQKGRRTTAGSSPGSRRSTAATQKRGSTARRGS